MKIPLHLIQKIQKHSNENFCLTHLVIRDKTFYDLICLVKNIDEEFIIFEAE